MIDEIITMEEAAALLGGGGAPWPAGVVRRLCLDGRIATFGRGSRRRTTRAAVLAYVARELGEQQRWRDGAATGRGASGSIGLADGDGSSASTDTGSAGPPTLGGLPSRRWPRR